jgi:hypothetical protein
MALPTISTAFVEEFEAGVHMAYQRMGSKLRGTVRTKNNVSNKTTFQKIGKGSATQKARHGDIPPMNLDHTNVSVTLEDWYAGEWIDDLDTLRINHDEHMVAQQSGAAALGRKTDEQLIAAMETTTSTADEATNGATLAWALDLMEAFGANDVPDDGQRYVSLAWETWSQLMLLKEFASQDWIGRDSLPFKNAGTAKEWLTFIWFPHSGMSAIAGPGHTGIAYHRSSVGHAIGADVQTNIQFHNDKDSWFVNNKMQMNAVLIDALGCFTLDIVDTP